MKTDAQQIADFALSVRKALDKIDAAAGSALIGYHDMDTLRQQTRLIMLIAERIQREEDDKK